MKGKHYNKPSNPSEKQTMKSCIQEENMVKKIGKKAT